MADLQKTIQIIFGGEDKLSYLTKDIDQSIGGVASSAETATQPLADLATGILAVETAIAAMGVVALSYAHNEAVKLNDAQASLQKVLQDSEGSASDYSEEIKNLSLQYGVAGEATTDTAAAFKQAGFTIEESLGLVDTALTGVKIAELSAEEAGSLLISNIRGLGVEADAATHFMDAWNEVSNNYAVTAKEVAEATGVLAPIAKTAGLSFDEMVGLVTPMIEVLGSGAEAANALKVGLANLISDNKRVTDALADLGIAQKDVNGDLRLSSEILADLGGIWPTLTESQQANFGIQLFGKEQYARMNIVLNDYQKTLDVTTLSENAAGSAKNELAVAMDKASVSADRFKVAMDYAAASVGTQFLEGSTNATNALASLASSFTDVSDSGELAPLLDYLNELLDEFAGNISTIATNLPAAFEGLDYSGLIDSFKEIGLEFGDLFGDVDLTTVEGLHNAIQSLIDGLAALNNLFAGVVSGFAPVIEAFKFMAESAGDADSSTAKFVGELIGTGASINVFAGALGGITSAFDGLSDVIITIAGAKALGLLPGSFGAAGTAAGVLGGAVLPLTAAFAGGLGIGNVIADLTPLDEGLTEVFVAIDRLIGGPLSKAEDQLAELAKTEKLAAIESKAYAESVDDVHDAHVQAYNDATKYDDVVNDMATSNKKAEQSTKDLSDQMEKMGLNADGTAKEIIKVEEATDGVAEKTSDFGDAASGAATNVDKLGESSKTVTKEVDKAAESALKAEIAYAEMAVELESIASNERIKTMEFAVDLKIAKVEADAKKVVAAFESISSSISSTNDLIGTLFSSEAPDWDRFGFDTEKAANDANDRANDLAEAQIKLIDAQIDQMIAQTKRMASGGALITVDGGELQPELELVMQALFKSIRIKMSSDYEDYLLALGTV